MVSLVKVDPLGANGSDLPRVTVSLVKSGKHRECKHDEATVCRTCGDETQMFWITGNPTMAITVIPGRGAHRQVSDAITCPHTIAAMMKDSVAA